MLAYRPAGHNAGEAEPSSQNEPTGQATDTTLLTEPPNESVDPAPQEYPGAQLPDGVVKLVAAQYCPAGQIRHWDASDAPWYGPYRPTTQATGVALPAAHIKPAPQRTGLTVPDAAQTKPGQHIEHTLAPVALENVPGAQI